MVSKVYSVLLRCFASKFLKVLLIRDFSNALKSFLLYIVILIYF